MRFVTRLPAFYRHGEENWEFSEQVFQRNSFAAAPFEREVKFCAPARSRTWSTGTANRYFIH